MKFNKEVLQELAGDYDGEFDGYEFPFEIVRNRIEDTSRWSTNHELIFKYGDKYYQVYYSQGATEQQCEYPFEYESEEIECDEVEPYEMTVTAYKKVTNE